MKDFKCLLVHTPQLCNKTDSNEVYSNINFCAMGLSSLAIQLEKEGFNSEIIHLGIEKYLNKNFLLSDYIKANNVKFIAFSLNWHPQSFDVIETIKVIKEKNPNIFVMLGGFTASYFGMEIMERFPFIDAIIKGEGELPIRKLARTVYENNTDFSNIPNLFWRKNKKVILNNKKYVATNTDLDSFEFFNVKKMKNFDSYSKVPFFMEYSKEDQLNNPMTSQGVCLGRGCTGNCTWCGGGCEAMKVVTGRNCVSYRNPDNVINEIKMLKEKCNLEIFRFTFDPNPQNRNHLITLLEKIEKEFGGNLKTIFTLNSLPDKIFLDAFSKTFSKDSTILISPEFFNEDLRKFHKSFFFTNQELETTLNYIEKLKIHSEIYFAILPSVKEEENIKSEKYGRLLKNKYSTINKYYIIPIVYEPAAPWTINPKKYNLDIEQRTFIDYYNDTKAVKLSFENINKFQINNIIKKQDIKNQKEPFCLESV